MYTIGIDIGGTSIKAGLVDDGEIISRISKETDRLGGAEKLVEDIDDIVSRIISENRISIEDISTIGIGIPGIVNKKNQVICVNLGIKNEVLAPKIKERFPLTEVKVENDANVAALAESRYGSMKGYDTGVMLTLGTGIGGGIIINGKPFSGAHGIGSEIGHIIISTNYFDCNCGNNGCFETFCSATAIIKYAQKLIDEGRETLILSNVNSKEDITAKSVFDAYREGDAVAIKVINRFKEYLAIGIANIINFLDPEVISIGGGISNASDIMLDGLEMLIRKHVIFSKEDIADIVIAKFKNDAGILGASAL